MSVRVSQDVIQEFEMEEEEASEEEEFLEEEDEQEEEEEEEEESFKMEDVPEEVPEQSTEVESEKSKPIELTKADIKELYRSHEPSYQHIRLPYATTCQTRLTERMREVRKIFKEELKKIITEQTSAFESVRIRRLYKTGIVLPERMFVEHEKGYTFQERERLRFLMSHEVF